MKSTVLKIARIGNSRGIRLPAAMIRKYHITDTVVAEERAGEIVLRPGGKRTKKLSWEETAAEMAASDEDWSDWVSMTGDGLDGL